MCESILMRKQDIKATKSYWLTGRVNFLCTESGHKFDVKAAHTSYGFMNLGNLIPDLGLYDDMDNFENYEPTYRRLRSKGKKVKQALALR